MYGVPLVLLSNDHPQVTNNYSLTGDKLILFSLMSATLETYKAMASAKSARCNNAISGILLLDPVEKSKIYGKVNVPYCPTLWQMSIEWITDWRNKNYTYCLMNNLMADSIFPVTYSNSFFFFILLLKIVVKFSL